MDTPITRAEHEEFRKRLEDEDHRQNRRIEILEKSVQQLNALTASVEKLALSIESMVKEQEQQGKRLEKQDERLDKVEARDGEKWRQAAGYVVTTVIGLIIGFVFKQIGM